MFIKVNPINTKHNELLINTNYVLEVSPVTNTERLALGANITITQILPEGESYEILAKQTLKEFEKLVG